MLASRSGAREFRVAGRVPVKLRETETLHY